MWWYSFWHYKCQWCRNCEPSPQLRYYPYSTMFNIDIDELLILMGWPMGWPVHLNCFYRILRVTGKHSKEYLLNIKRLKKFLRKHPELALENPYE